jgi:hypothetical protein
MAHFYANIRGNRGEATRMGSLESGIHGHIRGWNVGCLVACYVGDDGKDHVRVTLTSGSYGGHDRVLGDFTAEDVKILQP